MRLGFIGAGKAGCSLSRYLNSPQTPVSGFYSKTFEHAKQAADATKSAAFSDLQQVVSASDMIFITTPDSVISRIWEAIEKQGRETSLSLKGKTFCHCSGSLSSLVFQGAAEQGAFACALHPMQAMSSKSTDLAEAFFTADGDPHAVNLVRELLSKQGNPVGVIKPSDKKKYHMAASTASNLVVGLAQMAVDSLIECGFSPDMALQMLGPLMKGNIESICSKGPAQALTGPVERGDWQTVKAHLAELSGEKQDIYRLLSKQLLPAAREKNETRDYSIMQTILEEKDQ